MPNNCPARKPSLRQDAHDQYLPERAHSAPRRIRPPSGQIDFLERPCGIRQLGLIEQRAGQDVRLALHIILDRIDRIDRKQLAAEQISTEKLRLAGSPRKMVWSCPVDSPTVCSLRSYWLDQNQGSASYSVASPMICCTATLA